MQLFEQELTFYFHYCLNNCRKLVKLSICLWDTRETFTNNDKQNIFDKRRKRESENFDGGKAIWGSAALFFNSQIFYFIGMGLNIRFKQLALILIFEYTYIQNCIWRGNRIISHSLLSSVCHWQKKSSSSITSACATASRNKSFVTSL